MTIVTVNGTDIFYRERGSGEPLLLVHGTGFNADVWDRVIDPLAREYRVIAYDRRACQRSQGSPPSTMEYGRVQGEDMAGLLESIGASPATVVGWSAGGIFALHAALQHPDRIKRLILYEPPLYAIRFLDFPFSMGFIMTNFLRAIGRRRSAAETFTKMVLKYKDGRNSYDRLSAEFKTGLARDTDTLLAEFMAVAAEKLRPETLSRNIKAPAVIMIGEQSSSTLRKTSENLARILNNSPVIRLREANHLAHMDHPEIFVDAVKQALSVSDEGHQVGNNH
jgi:pimeloyl-ACP methyl ester carboxylesterase